MAKYTGICARSPTSANLSSKKSFTSSRVESVRGLSHSKMKLASVPTGALPAMTLAWWPRKSTRKARSQMESASDIINSNSETFGTHLLWNTRPVCALQKWLWRIS